jgi:ABC-type multidrug transport system fused ATPase/permease subunit
MTHYLWKLRPYFRHVTGQLVLGSITGILMNTAIVLPAILLGRAIDTAVAYARGAVAIEAVGWAVVLFVGGVFATEGPRLVKRWWLMTVNTHIRSYLRADALRGVLGWPMAQVHQTAIGDVMARIIGDAEVLGVGVREFSTEMWDTMLFSVSLVVAMAFYDVRLTALVLLPVPGALALACFSGRWASQWTTAARAVNAELTATLQEHLSGLRLLRLFGRSDAAVTRVANLAQQQADTNRATVRLRSALQPIYTVLINAGVVVLIWQGAEQVMSGSMTLGAMVAAECFSFLAAYATAYVAQGALRDLRVRLVDHLFRLPLAYYNRTLLGDVISRCTADVDTVDTLSSTGVADLVANLVRLATAMLAMVLLSPALTVVAMLSVPPLVVITRLFQRRTRDAERAHRTAVGLLNTHVQETLAGVEVIRAFGREQQFVIRFRVALQQALAAFNRATVYVATYSR